MARQTRRAQAKTHRKASTPRARTRAPRRLAVPKEAGPRKWLIPILESAYSALVPREQAPPAARAAAAAVGTGKPARGRSRAYQSRLQPGRGEDVLATPATDFWVERLKEYKQRKAAAAVAALTRAAAPGPVVPGARNWAPIGPSVVLNGQAQGMPAVGGRVAGIAVAPGGQRVYAASANGGVFRSDDAGQTWQSLMDAFDIDPTNFASTSLACGAIGIDAGDPDRIYVGTGEGDTYAIFSSRILNALPAYRGIGPIRSDDGGATWVVEETAPGSPGLAGKAFFAIAVDPGNRENVVAATTEGLYQRVVQPDGTPLWTRRRSGVYSSVVVASSTATTRFFAAEWGGGVVRSSNGSTWSAANTGFPTSAVGRIALAVQPTNPNLVYAFVANTNGIARGVFRREGATGSWKTVANLPDVLPADDGSSQGDYDLAIAVDPLDADLIYLGGSYFNDPEFWPASIWRCRVQAQGSAYRVAAGESVGGRVHADVHVLVHSPGDPNALWAGCDGGVFLNRDPRASANFGSRNNGLACLCPTFFSQHPTDPNVLFCGLQDNGTARTSGGSVWKHVNGGDGGYCLINWADPQKVLVFANGSIYRSTNGGLDHNSWTRKDFPWAMMTEPIVGTPYAPTTPAQGNIVALASGQQTSAGFRRVLYLSKDFGATWSTVVPVPTSGGLYSLVFASATRIFVGTSTGEVFRADQSASGTWSVTRVDNVAGGPLGLHGLVADLAVDWADPLLASIYVALGGVGDVRHVWHFDGSQWEARSGQAGGAAGRLLDVEHNAIVVDRAAPANVYVGADIGVWHSADAGLTWEPLPNGLPDAPVFDLQIHATRRLLRATTHGRGLYEFALSAI